MSLAHSKSIMVIIDAPAQPTDRANRGTATANRVHNAEVEWLATVAA